MVLQHFLNWETKNENVNSAKRFFFLFTVASYKKKTYWSGIRRRCLLFLCPRATAKAIGLYPESDSMVMSAPLAA